jgi:Neuraminidase (sialidase)
MSISNLSDEEQAVLVAEYNANKYKEDRSRAYPSIKDQLDKIFHEGIDAWKADIQSVKNAHPKPT